MFAQVRKPRLGTERLSGVAEVSCSLDQSGQDKNIDSLAPEPGLSGLSALFTWVGVYFSSGDRQWKGKCH